MQTWQSNSFETDYTAYYVVNRLSFESTANLLQFYAFVYK
jgi:hypothetical protein